MDPWRRKRKEKNCIFVSSALLLGMEGWMLGRREQRTRNNGAMIEKGRHS
jgi:hypothetical protein